MSSHRVAHYTSHLPTGDIVRPSGDFGSLEEQWVPLEKFNIALHAVLQLRERPEIDSIHGRRDISVIGLRVLHELLDSRRRECQHPTPGVMEDGNFTRA